MYNLIRISMLIKKIKHKIKMQAIQVRSKRSWIIPLKMWMIYIFFPFDIKIIDHETIFTSIRTYLEVNCHELIKINRIHSSRFILWTVLKRHKANASLAVRRREKPVAVCRFAKIYHINPVVHLSSPLSLNLKQKDRKLSLQNPCNFFDTINL